MCHLNDGILVWLKSGLTVQQAYWKKIEETCTSQYSPWLKSNLNLSFHKQSDLSNDK